MRYFRYILMLGIVGCMFAPQVHAQSTYTPGTDAYLRNEVGLSDVELSTRHKTEDREPFALVVDELSAEDPVADVLTRFGTRSGVNAGWADIAGVSFTQNDDNESWDVLIEVGEPIPENPPHKVQFWILTDSDNLDENNESSGIRINTDQSHMAKYDVENGWATDYRWYNTETDFWALNKETAATFAPTDEGNMLYQIPFDELPADSSPEWRVVAAVDNAGKTQIDVVPGVGFPSPKAASDEPVDTQTNQEHIAWWERIEWSTPHFILLTAIIASAVYLWYIFGGTRKDE